MLARISSAAGGICEYLESGRKRGREFDRDLIDERITLDGNLDVLDAAIEAIETKQDGDARYLHITLGFAEQFTNSDICGPGQINTARMREVTAAYREALMAAYDPSEYVWYAEAHVPKVTHELDARTGSYVDRLPHVHIVLPKRNLESGKYLDPVGYGENNIWAAEAIQEHINVRFGLRSPRDSQRDPTSMQHPIGKHDARIEGKSPAQLRAYAEHLVSTGRVASFEQLQQALAEQGVVTVRQGKDGDYLNLKPEWATRGINFKDLGREGFDMRAAELRVGQTTSDITANLARWLEQGAFEARYVTSPRMRSSYRAMDDQARTEFIADRRAETAIRLARHDRPHALQLADTAGAISARIASEAIDVRGAARTAQLTTFIKELSNDNDTGRNSSVDGSADRAEPANRTDVRKDRGRAQGAGRGGQRAAEDTRKIARALGHELGTDHGQPRNPTDSELKALTDPRAVLAAAQRLYGIDPAAYQVRGGRDGSPRIHHDGRQYNLGDFFTKHLGKSWAEARPVLLEAFEATPHDTRTDRALSDERASLLSRATAAIERGQQAAADPAAFAGRQRDRGLAQTLEAALRRLRGDRPQDKDTLTPPDRVSVAAAAIARAKIDIPTSLDLARAIARKGRGRMLGAVLHRATLAAEKKYPGATAIQSLRAAARPVTIQPDILKRDVNPALVIEAARRLYGIDPTAYEIGASKDGAPRIIHGARHYNAGDFLTKHLQRPWGEAQNVLRDCYHASMADTGPEPNGILWRQFSQWRNRRITAATVIREELSAGFREKVLIARETYKAAKEGAKSLTPRQRATAVAKARADRFLTEQGIAAQRVAAFDAIKNPPRHVHYREFLSEQAEKGDVAALAELRRMATFAPEEAPDITGRRSQPVFPLPSYRVDQKGGVTYSNKDGAIVRDGAQGVAVLRATEPAYDAAIRVAMARYGNEITLRGDPQFMKRMTEAAQRTGLELRIHDAARPKAAPIHVLPRHRQQNQDR